MDELLDRITRATGLEASVATKAIGIILAFLKKEGPPDAVQQLLSALPGSDSPFPRPRIAAPPRGSPGRSAAWAVASWRSARS
jgi:hypothetical protein